MLGDQWSKVLLMWKDVELARRVGPRVEWEDVRCVPSWHHSHQILSQITPAWPAPTPQHQPGVWHGHCMEETYPKNHGRAGMRPVRAITSWAMEKIDGSISCDCKMQQCNDKSLLLPPAAYLENVPLIHPSLNVLN